jgi:ribose 1,5-bisphosphate isomerase
LKFRGWGVRMGVMTINPAIEDLIQEVREDKTHGASQLASQSLEVLRVAAMASRARTVGELQAELGEIGKVLMVVRPSMAPVYNAVNRLLEAVNNNHTGEVSTLRQDTMLAVNSLVQASVKAVARIAELAAGQIQDGDVILTHSYSSTVTAALKAAHGNLRISVIVTRSGAGRIGERTVWELAYSGIPVTFIDDTAAGLFMSQVSKVLVGADRICVDGALINGIGTYLLALAAKKSGVPFYVLSDTLKFDTRTKGSQVELEEKEPAEVSAPETLPEEAVIRNPYFDVTPPDLITAIITENGLVIPPSKLP